jgi:hypothetical protein
MCIVGSVDNYTRRVIAAICRLTRQQLRWPDGHERNRIKRIIGMESIFFDCVGFMDGVFIPFAYRPTVHGASDFFSRKHRYSMNDLVVCDPSKRFTYLLLGNAAAANDQAVVSESDVRNLYSQVIIPLARASFSICSSSLIPNATSAERNTF